MKVITFAAVFAACVFIAALTGLMLTEDERVEGNPNEDEDKDGGFLDDWRLP